MANKIYYGITNCGHAKFDIAKKMRELNYKQYSKFENSMIHCYFCGVYVNWKPIEE
ncbi:hypothetical protein [Spiroplasma endosymbiont of Labia minor]|uniref:hypothetical protein n=1 Tax=Spiroplasma endosymbiont of Labia minor TaxID=3066305 RepID=UPI0030CD8C3C